MYHSHVFSLSDLKSVRTISENFKDLYRRGLGILISFYLVSTQRAPLISIGGAIWVAFPIENVLIWQFFGHQVKSDFIFCVDLSKHLSLSFHVVFVYLFGSKRALVSQGDQEVEALFMS